MIDLFYGLEGLILSFMTMITGIIIALKYKDRHKGLVFFIIGLCLWFIRFYGNRIEPEICECCGQIIQ